MPANKKFPVTRPERLALDHRDYELLQRLEEAIYRHAEGVRKFETDIPILLRKAIDEVIDTPRSGRFLLSELQNSEKTYLGTKVEILLRSHLKLQRSTRFDVVIDGVDVDIKNTVGNSWMIPKEVIGHPCVLIRTDEKTARCWFGIVIAHADVLNPGGNQDKKTTISAEHFVNVLWMLYAHSYPKNFWEDVSVEFRNHLVSLTSGNKKVAAFFRKYLGVPIPRQLVESLAPQKDPMKRMRKNGGAPDQLEKEGIALLSGAYNAPLIKALGLPPCKPDEWIGIHATKDEELTLLKKNGFLL